MIHSAYKPVGASVRDKVPSPNERLAIYGTNSDVDVGATEDIWNGGGLYPWLTTTTSLEVISSSTNDTSAGTGARTVVINGLDASFTRITQVITLNGLSATSIPTSLYRINSAVVASAGSVQTNVGNIIVRDVATSTTRALIDAGHGASMQCVYTVPNGFELVLTSVLVSINRTDTADRWASISSWLRTPSGVILKPAEIGISSDSPYRDKYDVPAVMPKGTDLAIQAEQVSNNSTNITASLMGYLGKL